MNSQALAMSIVFCATGVLAGITALNAPPDGASMALRFLTVAAVAAPWAIAGVIVRSPNEIAQTTKVIRQ